MAKNKLFDEESEEEVAIKTENEYAKKYDAWREKEERHKLEQKYGSKSLDSDASSSSDSEDESDEPLEVSEETEAQFLKTLSLLKTKDPRIYDPNYKFFDEKAEKEKVKEENTKKVVFADSDEDDDDDDGNIFSIEKKAEVNEEKQDVKKDDKLKDYLTGKVEHVEEEVEKDLAPLKALWSDPKISEGEAFLRDYILNKRYLDEGDAGEAEDRIRDDADLEADEEIVEEQGKFERAYNFRFEEPDDEYLKRFPRTMNSIRPKDDRRSRKRAEIRERKEAEKRSKMEEIARLKALKLKEVQEKIAKLRDVTGNQNLAFNDEDIEGEFDPEEHDRRMKAIFDEEYYGEADDKKPVFPDLDEELEIENWENYEEQYNENVQTEDGPHCEDDDFNMDADYDPKKARENLLEELKRNMGKKRRNRKKKSKLADLLAEEKPKFIPEEQKTYAEFMEEYYKMDCEDIIGGDLPTRFKYREVVPNDYGLSIEEILLADDKELTQWVPLKKIVKFRPPNVEKGEIKTYALKAADAQLKKKILPSLFKELPQEPELVVPAEENKKKRKKKKKAKSNGETDAHDGDVHDNNITEDTKEDNNVANTEVKSKNKKKKSKVIAEIANNDQETEVVDETKTVNVDKNNKKKIQDVKEKVHIDQEDKTDDVIVERKKKKQKIQNDDTVQSKEENVELGEPIVTVNDKNKKHGNDITVQNVIIIKEQTDPSVQSAKTKKEKKEVGEQRQGKAMKRKLDATHEVTATSPNSKKSKNKNKNKKKKKLKLIVNSKSNNPLSKLSDERLKAFGLNPKKYRGFLKYKKF
ncbi:protein KRI1 homolog [Battus philenor]|uniref:protein KRI1 homolog n=1 Tax=Battus philenor TaxID=42288 RepID=UPI0035CF6F52